MLGHGGRAGTVSGVEPRSREGAHSGGMDESSTGSTSTPVTPVTPAGAWTARVSRTGGTHTSVLHFTVDGRVFVASGGAGNWTPTGPGRFSFRIAEPVFDDGGRCVGWVDVMQQAVLSGGTFTGSGTSVVHGADGDRLRSTRVGIAARALR